MWRTDDFLSEPKNRSSQTETEESEHWPYSGHQMSMYGIWPAKTGHIIKSWCPENGQWELVTLTSNMNMAKFHWPYSGHQISISGIWYAQGKLAIFGTSNVDVRNIDSRKKWCPEHGQWCPEYGQWCPEYAQKILVMSEIWPVFTGHSPDINFWCSEYGHIPDIVRCPEYGQGGLGYLIQVVNDQISKNYEHLKKMLRDDFPSLKQ